MDVPKNDETDDKGNIECLKDAINVPQNGSEENPAKMGSSFTSPNISPGLQVSSRITPSVAHGTSMESTRDNVLYRNVISGNNIHDSAFSVMSTANPTTQQSQHQAGEQSISTVATNRSIFDRNSSVFSEPETNPQTSSDKYPCLRHALACHEVPILPLGTYAIEFGFDCRSLPFDSTTPSVPALLKDDNKCPSPVSTEENDCVEKEKQSPDRKRVHSRIRESTDHSCTSENATDVPFTRDSSAPRHTKRRSPNKHSPKSACTSTDSVPQESISPKRVRRSESETTEPCETIYMDVRSSGKGDGDKNGGDRSMYDEHSVSDAENQERSNRRIYYDEQKDTVSIYDASYWFASIFKKDNRRWLWKTSRRTPEELVACNEMYRSYRKTWVYKSNQKET